MKYQVSNNSREIKGSITLDGSKSISNRVLIIKSLCDSDFEISNLSTSDDTKALQKALNNADPIIDVGAAGTTMRFLTALLSITDGQERIITGSDRMKQRPIGILVEALKSLGAEIEYLEKEGFPPLKIQGKKLQGGDLKISASVSSQFLSALLMVAPKMEKGLNLILEGQLVSRPYLEMTLKTMKAFGVEYQWNGQEIKVEKGNYKGKAFTVEADWSAASYHYAILALADSGEIELKGLFEQSLQGDSVLAEIMKSLTVETRFEEEKLILSKTKSSDKPFEFDFIECPDLAQSIAVICAALKVNASFSGLQTLAIKETDRTAALSIELGKFGISFYQDGSTWKLETEQQDLSSEPEIATYHDHRMAMAFAPLALKFSKGISIQDPMVVTKSYPEYWNDLRDLNFKIIELDN